MNKTALSVWLSFLLAFGAQSPAGAAIHEPAPSASTVAEASAPPPRWETVAVLGIGMMIWGLVNGDGMMGPGKKGHSGHGKPGENTPEEHGGHASPETPATRDETSLPAEENARPSAAAPETTQEITQQARRKHAPTGN